MVKPEKFDHLHLVYHFKIPLTAKRRELFSQKCPIVDVRLGVNAPLKRRGSVNVLTTETSAHRCSRE